MRIDAVVISISLYLYINNIKYMYERKKYG